MIVKLIGIFLLCQQIVSAQKTLDGTVYLYQEKGSNQPLSNVSIIAPGSRSVMTKESGNFSFTFDNSIVTTTLQVVRIGYEIINEEDMLNIDLAKNKKVNIYFDQEGNTEKRKRLLIDSSLAQLKRTRDNYYRILEKGGSEAERLKLKLEKEFGKKFNNMDEVKSHLFDKYGGDSKTIERIFTSIIRLNLDHKNKDVEKIKEYTLSGDLTSALALLNFEAAFKEVRKNNNLISAARESNKAEKEKFMSGIPLLVSNGLFDKVDSAYQLAYLADSTDVKLLENFAYYLKVQNQISRSIPLFRQLVRYYKDEAFSKERAETLGNLGIVLVASNHDDEAMSCFKEALKIYDRLSETNKDTLPMEKGMIYAGMADAVEKTDKAASEKYIRQSLNYISRFTVGHSVNLSNAVKDFGSAIEKNDTKAQVRILKELIDICKPFVEKNPGSQGLFNAFVASSYRQIGIALQSLGEKDEAKYYVLQSLNAFRQFAKYNPAVYEPEVALSLGNMGLLLEHDKPEEAIVYFEELLALYRKLAVKDTDTYLPQVIRSLHQIGKMAKDEGDEKKAILMFEEEIKLYSKYIGKDEQMTESGYAGRLNYATSLLIRTGQLDSAQMHCKKAMEIYQRLAVKEPNRYDTLVAGTYSLLATIAVYKDQLDTALYFYEEALKVGDRLNTLNRVLFNYSLMIFAYQCGNLSMGLEDKSKAVNYYKKAVGFAKALYKRDNGRMNAVSDMYSGLFKACKELKDKDNLFKYCNEYLDFFRSHLALKNQKQNFYSMADAMSEAGNVFSYLCIPDSAQIYYRSALSFTKQGIQEIGIVSNEADREGLISYNGNASWYSALAKEFEMSIQYAMKGLELEKDAPWIKTNLAHARLLQGNYEEAEKLYTALISAPAQEGGGAKRVKIILDDLQILECAGSIPPSRKPDINRIRSIMNH